MSQTLPVCMEKMHLLVHALAHIIAFCFRHWLMSNAHTDTTPTFCSTSLCNKVSRKRRARSNTSSCVIQRHLYLIVSHPDFNCVHKAVLFWYFSRQKDSSYAANQQTWKYGLVGKAVTRGRSAWAMVMQAAMVPASKQGQSVGL